MHLARGRALTGLVVFALGGLAPGGARASSHRAHCVRKLHRCAKRHKKHAKRGVKGLRISVPAPAVLAPLPPTPAPRIAPREPRAQVMLPVQPTVSDEPLAKREPTCEPPSALEKRWPKRTSAKCERFLLGTITVSSPAAWITVSAPACEWFGEATRNCSVGHHDELVLYEWEGAVGDPAEPTRGAYKRGLATSPPPVEGGQYEAAWRLLEEHPIDSSAQYQALAFWGPSSESYGPAEVPSPLPLLP